MSLRDRLRPFAKKAGASIKAGSRRGASYAKAKGKAKSKIAWAHAKSGTKRGAKYAWKKTKSAARKAPRVTKRAAIAGGKLYAGGMKKLVHEMKKKQKRSRRTARHSRRKGKARGSKAFNPFEGANFI